MIIVLLASTFASLVSFNGYADNGRTVYICILKPFVEVFADAGFTETVARYKVQNRCEKLQGEGSMFCRASEAQCSQSTLAGSAERQYHEHFFIYSETGQTGRRLKIRHDEPDLSNYNFDHQMSSYHIPQGWVVRFYEGKYFTGGYYTRKGGDGNATDFDKRTSSVKILQRD